MTDPRKTKFGLYLRCLADLMGLRDWTVGIEEATPDPDNLAECECRYGRKIAWIRLSDCFLDAAPESQRQTLVHELLHVHLAFLERLMKAQMTDTAHEPYNMALEYAVDGIAEEWAKTLPLPDHVKPPEVPPMAKKSAKKPAAKKVFVKATAATMPMKDANGHFVKGTAKTTPKAMKGKGKAKGK